MALKIYYKNMTDNSIGKEHGISHTDLENIKPEIEKAHKLIQKYHDEKIAGFMDLPNQKELVKKIKAIAKSIREDFEYFVVIGIGGSALGNIALHHAFNTPNYNLKNKPKFFVLDNVDPEKTADVFKNIDVNKTLFNVITKSGGTAETMSNFMIARDKLKKSLEEDYFKHIFATTDPKSGLLKQMAEEEDFAMLTIPQNVGGRFSVLTPVGLLSAAVVGIDIEKLLQGAGEMAEKCRNEDIHKNPAYLLGALHYLAEQKGKNINVMMPYSNALADFADWYRQLWAESLGKNKTLDGDETCKGLTPVKALGAIDQHSQVQLYVEGPNDKTVTFLQVENFREDVLIPNGYPKEDALNYLGGKYLSELLNAELAATEYALTQHKRPNCRIIFPEINEHSIGEFIYLMELQTMFTGFLYDINPFDQPGVEWGKKAAYGMMGRKGYEKYKIDTELDDKFIL